LRQHALARQQQLLPRRRQRERAVLTREQLDAEVVFEGTNLPADGRLRDEALVGGTRERQVPRGRFEGQQKVQRRQAVEVFSHALSECQEFQIIVCRPGRTPA
jgi:hypothetical protein